MTILVNATPIHSEDGALESFVAIIQDLTPVEEMARLRAEFLSMVSHELQARLSSIKGSAATLLDASFKRTHRRYASSSASSTGRPTICGD